MSIFKAYDIRGIYGQDLNEDIFYRIARAYAQFCGFTGKGKVVVARDCRTSSDSMFAAFAKGLVDEGVDVLDIGMASTPMSYFANATLKADGSVMITASHNTKEWNGCKLCKANAVPISGATGIKDIEKIFEGISLNEPPAGVGEVTKVDVSAQYAEHVKTFAHLKRPLHLALDFANGMGIAEAAAFSQPSTGRPPAAARSGPPRASAPTMPGRTRPPLWNIPFSTGTGSTRSGAIPSIGARESVARAQ